ncbi:MAG: TauD/TfdA family dioxygenase, partial [Acetobacteraceae bacterium]|nr:TauD/TfdA family dioxygenase [Acetobacteraceae bacterium]
ERHPAWDTHVTAPQADEIAAAVAAVAARGLRGAEFAREDFPLPGLARVLADALEELEHGRGVVLFRGLPVDAADEEGAARIAWGLGLHLGRPLRQNPRVNLAGYRDGMIGHITDQGIDYNAPNAIGSGTSAEQMPHVDGSDLVGLLCVRPAADGGGISRIASSMAIWNALLERAPEVIPTLEDGFLHDLRGAERTGGGPLTPFRIPVYSHFGGVLSCNFNSKTVEQAARKRGEALTPAERRALDAVLHVALDPAYQHEMTLRTGDLQVLNNYTVLHSRTAWRDPPGAARKRLMLRLWLKSFEARPLAANFAGGYVSGASYDVAGARVN